MALNNLSSSLIQDTYEKLVQTEGGLLADGSGSAIDSLTVTASYATQALTASFALNVVDTTDTGSLMTTGSISGNTLTFTKGDASTFDIDLSGITVDTGSFMTTGSITDATITFTKGDGTTFDIVVPDTDVSALNAFTASADSRLNALETETGSLQTQIDNINTAVGGLSASAETGDLLFENIYGEVYGTSTVPVGGNITISASSTKVDGATVILYHSGSIEPTVSGGTISKKTGIYDTSGATNVITFVRDTDSKFIQYIAGAGVTSVASASYAGNAELLDGLDSSAFAQVGQNNSFTGTQTFNNIAVNGTGSFAYIQQVTGSAKVIGDAFLILNNDTPTQRYGGIKVQDSGSTNVTASLFWDGFTNDWKYEFSTGSTHEGGVVLFGPEGDDLGTLPYPLSNVIQKGTGGHHLTGSSLTDDGAVVKTTATSGLHLDALAPQLILSSSTTDVYNQGPEIIARGGTFTIKTILNSPVAGAGNFKLDANRDAFINVSDQFYLTTHDGNPGVGDTYWTDNGTSDFQIRANSVSNSGSIWFKPSSAADAGIRVQAVRNHSSIADFSETDNNWKDWVVLGPNTSAAPDPAISFQRDVEITGSLSFSGTLAGTVANATSASHAVQADSALSATSASHAVQANNATTADSATTATTASYVENAQSASAASTFTVNTDLVLNGATTTIPAVTGYTTGSLVDNVHPTIASSSAQIQHIVTIDQEQYNSISQSAAVDDNTFYIISDATDDVLPDNLQVNGQIFSPTFAGTIASSTSSIDFNNGNFATLNCASSTHVADPTNLKSGTTYTIIITNGANISGYGSAFKFAGGTAPTFSANTDILTAVSDGTSLYATGLADFS